MQNVSLGDVIFIVLILGVVHGIMHLIAMARKRKVQEEESSDNQ